MAVGVVDALEVVDVQQPAAAPASPLRATRSTSRASASSKLRRLARPGQRVAAGQVDQRIDQPCSQPGLPGSPAGSNGPA
jgi:hypothetical protein